MDWRKWSCSCKWPGIKTWASGEEEKKKKNFLVFICDVLAGIYFSNAVDSLMFFAGFCSHGTARTRQMRGSKDAPRGYATGGLSMLRLYHYKSTLPQKRCNSAMCYFIRNQLLSMLRHYAILASSCECYYCNNGKMIYVSQSVPYSKNQNFQALENKKSFDLKKLKKKK